MAFNHETLSDFEVVTAEWAQEHLMDQVIVQADTYADLANIPTAVKTAYVLAEGQMYIRDDLNNWKRGGGAAEVSETEPTNPATGQLWVRPSEVLPIPYRTMLHTSTGTITATSWATLPGSVTKSFAVPYACMVQVTMGAWMSLTSASTADIRARLAWSGATTGDSYSHVGWGNVLYQGHTAGGGSTYMSHQLTTTIVLAPGTTNFNVEAYKTNASSMSNVNYVSLEITPIAWADEYADGVA